MKFFPDIFPKKEKEEERKRVVAETKEAFHKLRETLLEIAEKNKRLKILMVENGDGDIEKKYFEDKGHIVFLAQSIEDGLRIYMDNKDSLDAIVIELQLPDGDGIDILKELKDEKKQKLVVTSTKPNVEKIHEIKSLGASFLSKPFDFDLALRFLKYA